MSPLATSAVELRGVEKSFGRQSIYRGLDLAVRKGETLTIVGPSGSGKSVLLKLIIGLHKPDAGEVLVSGVDVAPMGHDALRQVRKRVAMLFQGAALFDSLTVGENVAYGLREHHFDWRERRVWERVAECLEWVGLPGIERRNPSDLSGGMKKRVGLARALAPGPEVILYDEPTTGLDPANARRINELILELKERLHVTSIVITHDMASAFSVSDRIALIGKGRVSLIVDASSARTASPPELETFVRGDDQETSP